MHYRRNYRLFKMVLQIERQWNWKENELRLSPLRKEMAEECSRATVWRDLHIQAYECVAMFWIELYM
jgi:hypothetical protein